LTTACLSAPAAAQETIEEAAPDLQFFTWRVGTGTTLETLLQNLENDFAQLGAGGTVITADDLAAHKAMTDASRRAVLPAHIMYLDVDADGFVTQEEVRRVFEYRNRGRGKFGAQRAEKRVQQTLDEWMPFDADGDGRIAWSEAIAADLEAFAKYVPDSETEDHAKKIELAMTFDADGDDRLTLAEFMRPGIALFKRVDTDDDGVISEDESNTFVDSLPFVTRN
jgi:Ca2+-binding EF-hand superfamily protein